MFASCELCQRSTLAFDECNDMFAQFKWYLLPTGIQRMLPMILNFVQQPTEIKCFGSAACNREMFSYVSAQSNQSLVRSMSIQMLNKFYNFR